MLSRSHKIPASESMYKHPININSPTAYVFWNLLAVIPPATDCERLCTHDQRLSLPLLNALHLILKRTCFSTAGIPLSQCLDTNDNRHPVGLQTCSYITRHADCPRRAGAGRLRLRGNPRRRRRRLRTQGISQGNVRLILSGQRRRRSHPDLVLLNFLEARSTFVCNVRIINEHMELSTAKLYT